MSPFAYDPDRPDSEKLVMLIQDLRSFLDDLIERWDQNLLIPELSEDCRDAWSELKQDNHFDELIGAIKSAPSERVHAHGLTGRQLNFKLGAINFFYERFLGSPVAAYLKRFLEVLDKILTSIIDAVGAGGAVGEMKNFLESLVKA